MKAIMLIENEEKKEIIFENIEDKSFFSTVKDGENYTIDLSNHLYITMESKSHKTIVKIEKEKDCFIEVIDDNGSILVPINVLAFNENNDMISLVYKIENMVNSIKIEFK